MMVRRAPIGHLALLDRVQFVGPNDQYKAGDGECAVRVAIKAIFSSVTGLEKSPAAQLVSRLATIGRLSITCGLSGPW